MVLNQGEKAVVAGMNVWAGFNDDVAEAFGALNARVQRSLVIVHDGHQGAGAGVVWRAGGYIVTNHHVIAHRRIGVTLADGRECPARLVADLPEMDLALLQVDGLDLPVAPIADSRGLRVGQIVLAAGHPWGQRGAVSVGIVSGLGTAQAGGRRGAIPVIRSDVGLAPGNSGGPLVNTAGGVVGINTMIVGGDLGVAIPSHVVEAFVGDILDRDGSSKFI
jgi:serine protease Do